jgi:hypothetical protein
VRERRYLFGNRIAYELTKTRRYETEPKSLRAELAEPMPMSRILSALCFSALCWVALYEIGVVAWTAVFHS